MQNYGGNQMIGIIVTGHGSLAEGMYSAVRLLAGKPEHFETVEYRQEDTTDDLAEKLKEKLDLLSECTDGILIFTDIENGAPYREAVELKRECGEERRIEVIAGMNLGMIMQSNIARSYLRDLDAFADLAVEEGKKQILRYDACEGRGWQ